MANVEWTYAASLTGVPRSLPTFKFAVPTMSITALFRFRSLASLLSLAALGIAAGLLLGKLYVLWPALG